MDNDTTIYLTSTLRGQMEEALLADINDRSSRTREGSLSYLGILLHAADGVAITGHELEDVYHYFQLGDA